MAMREATMRLSQHFASIATVPNFVNGTLQLDDMAGLFKFAPRRAHDHAFSVSRNDSVEHFERIGFARANALRNNSAMSGQDERGHRSNPVRKDTELARHVEHIEGHLVPVCESAAHDALAFVQCVRPDVELSAQGGARHFGFEPIWGVEDVAVPAEKLAAGPLGAQSIELFRNPVALHGNNIERRSA